MARRRRELGEGRFEDYYTTKITEHGKKDFVSFVASW